MNSQSIDALRPEVWGKDLYADVMDQLYFTENGLMGEDDNNIVQIKPDLKNKKGDTVTFGLTAKLATTGVTGDSELEGNESYITPYSQSVAIDQWRDGVRLDGILDERKNAYNMRMDAKGKLKILLQETIERQVFLKLAGVRNTNLVDVGGVVVGTLATFSNSPAVVPAADEAAGFGNRYLCANLAQGTDSLTVANKMTPTLISRAKVKAQLATPRIQPLKVNGKDYYILFIHPWQAYDLKYDGTFLQAMREAEVRGKENPIFAGALGIWDGVIIKEHEYVPFLDVSVLATDNFAGDGAGTTCAVDCFRALFCGKQAMVYAQCETPNAWVEKTFDYDNQTGFAVGMIAGFQKTAFNSKDYAVIAIDTAASDLS